MCAPIFRVILMLCVCTIVSQPATARLRAGNTDDVLDFLLAKTQERLAPITNYRCNQIIWQEQNSLTPERRTLSIDLQGRGRVRTDDGQNTLTFVCDGAKTIEIRENTGPDGSVTRSASIVPEMQHLMRQYNQPWQYIGGTLADELTSARDAQARIRAMETSTGHYRIDIRDRAGSIRAIILDPGPYPQ